MTDQSSRVGAWVVAACTAFASGGWAATVEVRMPTGEYVFAPRAIVINTGDTVQWTNGSDLHTVTADDASFDSGSITAGSNYSHTFPSQGTFSYHCTFHSSLGMRGVVYVGNRTARAADEVVLTLAAWDFEGLNSTTTTSVSSSTRTISGGSAFLEAGVSLPSGARITGLEFSGCDVAGAGDPSVTLVEYLDPPGGSPSASNSVTFAILGGGACGLASSAPVDWTVDNLGYSYMVEVSLPLATETLRSVRVFYRRPRMPVAPLVAGFGDVAVGSDYYQAIEALRLAGITTGCGGGNYCPKDAINREQLALLLARALFTP